MDKIDLTQLALAKELKKKSAPVMRSQAPSALEEAYFSKKNRDLVNKLKKKKV